MAENRKDITTRKRFIWYENSSSFVFGIMCSICYVTRKTSFCSCCESAYSKNLAGLRKVF